METVKEFSNDIIEFVRKRKVYTVFMIIILLMAFGFEITNFTLSNDEEQYINSGNDALWFIKQGRFGITIFNLLFLKFGMFGPFLSTLIAVVFLLFSATIFCVTFDKINTKKEINDVLYIIFSGLYCTLPFVVAEYMIFASANIQYSFGLCCVATAIYFLNVSKKKNGIILSVIFSYCAFSIYQGFSVFFVEGSVIVITFILLQQTDKYCKFKEYCIMCLKHMGVFAVAMVLYLITAQITYLFIEPSNYLESFESNEGYIDVLTNIFKRFYMLDIGYGSDIIKFATVLVLLVIFLLILSNVRKWKYVAVTSLLACVFPWMLFIILKNSNVQYRTLYGLQLLVGSGAFLFLYVLWYVVFTTLKDSVVKRIIKFITYFVLIICMIQQVQIINDLFYSDYIRYQSDIRITENILDNISEKYPDYLDKKIVFVGGMTNPKSEAIKRLQVIGMSIYEWEGGNNARIIPFINSMGYHFPVPSQEDINFANSVAYTTPVYPNIESITCVNDIIVVHLGNIE